MNQKKSKSIQMEGTPLLEKTWNFLNNSEYRYLLHVGGSRSSKSMSIIQSLILYALSNKNKVISIVRESLKRHREAALRDFMNIMKDMGIYEEDRHSLTQNNYTFKTGSIIEFISTSIDPGRLKGPQRDILYCNEVTEITEEAFMQLRVRTKGKIICDYNPSEEDSFIYKFENDPKSLLIKSTYKDNTYLSKEQVEEIESLINTDENWYKIYVLGEKPTKLSKIYTHFQYVDSIPKSENYCYGVDFGYNDPAVIVKLTIDGNKFYFEELLYQEKLTTSDLIKEMNLLNLNKAKAMYCDSSQPAIIEELRRNGYNSRKSDKNILEGIKYLKSKEILVSKDSLNILKEQKFYCWKEGRDGVLSNEPVDKLNHAMDAMRYASYSSKKNTSSVSVYVYDM